MKEEVMPVYSFTFEGSNGLLRLVNDKGYWLIKSRTGEVIDWDKARTACPDVIDRFWQELLNGVIKPGRKAEKSRMHQEEEERLARYRANEAAKAAKEERELARIRELLS